MLRYLNTDNGTIVHAADMRATRYDQACNLIRLTDEQVDTIAALSGLGLAELKVYAEERQIDLGLVRTRVDAMKQIIAAGGSQPQAEPKRKPGRPTK